MSRSTRTREADNEDARTRTRAAVAYLEVAEVVLDDDSVAMPGVAAGLAVLAGIAASDAICARRLGLIYRGEDHRGASKLLSTATPDGVKLSQVFRRLIDVKDEAHYGLTLVSSRKARDTVRWAHTLVARAREELER